MVYDKLCMKYNSWDSIEYNSTNDEYSCTCKCGTVEKHNRAELLYDKLRMCKECIKHDNVERQRTKYEDMTFGSWHVENFIGNRKYLCRCINCNTVYERVPTEFKRGKSTKCKKCAGKNLKDLRGKTFGSYYVIEYVGNHYWKCKCIQCGDTKLVTSQHLTLNNNEKCIKCSNKENGTKRTDEAVSKLIGKQFGNLVVQGFDYDKHKCICECQCDKKTTVYVSISNLKSGSVKSCGCLCKQFKNNTMLSRYGDIASSRISNPRDINDILDISNNEAFAKRYNELENRLGRTPKSIDVAKEFDVNTANALKYAHKYSMNIDTDTHGQSKYEIEIYEMLKNTCARMHVRNVIYPQELDIYIPDKKIAIEFNGDYWHSDRFIDKYYHQNKTITCAKRGIKLIHIFEHEWVNDDTRKKLNYMINKINGLTEINMDASKLMIEHINKDGANSFLNKYNLFNEADSDINIGLLNQKELLAVLVLSNINRSNYIIERFCVKQGYKIDNALEIMLKRFIIEYKPNSISADIDISKFSGETYRELGFSCTENDIKEPTFVWVNSLLDVINIKEAEKTFELCKYKENIGHTVEELMNNLKYFKVYNGGFLRMILRLN